MKSQVTTIIESFENGSLDEATALAQLRELTGREVDADWLRTYSSAESLENFVDRLCAPPIQNWQQLTDEGALALITEYLETESQGRQESIATALQRRYGKTSGTIIDLVFEQELDDPDEILKQLKRNTRIYL